MTDLVVIFIFVALIFIVNFILLKKKLLLNNTGKFHQSYTNNYIVPLSGGIFILIFLFFFVENYLFLFFIFILFNLGFLADLNIFNSPSKRFIFQIILIFLIVSFLDIKINDLRIDFLNSFLQNSLINLTFCSLCFLVLINGSNFIDGNNCLSIGYYLLITIIISKISNLYNIQFFFELNQFTLLLIILLIFNFFNKLYLGDSGIYLLSFTIGYLLINIYRETNSISPYFIANLLWYPSFEILFSFFRKLKSKNSPMEPDTFHLHQLLYYLLNRKLNIRNLYSNSVTGILINIYLFFIILLAMNFMENTKLQVSILVMNILNYLIIYSYLYKNYRLGKK